MSSAPAERSPGKLCTRYPTEGWSRRAHTQGVENEHLCLKLTAALGLPSTRTEVVGFDGERVLVIERFDRHWTKDERLLRLLSVPPTLKYEADGGPGMADVLGLLKGTDDPATDQRMFLKVQIVFWLLGASDGHAKNLSIFLRPGARFNLIRVNALNLGWMDTPGEDVTQRRYHSRGKDWLADAEAQMPFGRLLKPAEVARAIAFLASDESGMMTGALVDFDQSVMGGGGGPIAPPIEEWDEVAGVAFS